MVKEGISMETPTPVVSIEILRKGGLGTRLRSLRENEGRGGKECGGGNGEGVE